jgi:hypothetical protein
LNELQRRHKQLWDVQLAAAASDERDEIDGRNGRGEWTPVSVEEKRLHALVVTAHAVRTTEAAAGRRGRKKGSGIDTLVRHLRDVEKLRRYSDVVEVLRASRILRITEHVESWGDNAIEPSRNTYARGGAAHAEACDYCASGLSADLQKAITWRKSPLI